MCAPVLTVNMMRSNITQYHAEHDRVKSRCNMVHYNMPLHVTLQWLRCDRSQIWTYKGHSYSTFMNELWLMGLYSLRRHKSYWYRIPIIALWGWFSHDVSLVTCCKHGPPSIAKVHFSKFSIATKILFNWIPFNPVKQVFRFSWQLFICVPWQSFLSNSAIPLATMKWAKNCPF